MQRTKIDWADYVWNPVDGCTKVSAGCQNCYAEGIAIRFWGERKFSEVQCHPEKLDEPIHVRKPGIVFVNSMSDLFHPDVPDKFIDQIGMTFTRLAVQKKDYVFVVLTKRPERMQKYFSDISPVTNLWLGVSVEDQITADLRIPVLLKTPAAKHIVSVEPMLSQVDLDLVRHEPCSHPGCFHHISHPCEGCARIMGKRQIDWVICGKETGHKARYFDPNWAWQLQRDCREAGIAFWWKNNPDFQERPK